MTPKTKPIKRGKKLGSIKALRRNLVPRRMLP